MAKKPPKKPDAPAYDPNESFFGEATTNDVFAPEAAWTPIDLPAHVEKKRKQAEKRKKKRPETPRSAEAIGKSMWESPDEARGDQPKAVTVIPTPRAKTALIQTLPDGAVHTIQPPQGVEALVVSTASPEPDALTVDHSGRFEAPKTPQIRFGGGGGRGGKTSAPSSSVTSTASSLTSSNVQVSIEPSKISSIPVSAPEETPPGSDSFFEPQQAPAPKTAKRKSQRKAKAKPDAVPVQIDEKQLEDLKKVVEPESKETEANPSLADQRPGERGQLTIDPAIVEAAQTVRREGFLFARKLKEKVFGTKQASTEEIEARKALIGLSARFKNTLDVVSQNKALFAELAENDAQVKNMLAKMNDERITKIVEKIIKGERVHGEENELLLDNWEKILDQLNKIGVSLEVNFNELFTSAKATIGDSRVDLNTRRDLVRNIMKVADNNKLQSSALDELKAIDLQQVNFTKEQTEHIEKLLEKIEPDVQNIKMRGTMNEMNSKMSAFLLDNRKFHDLMETQAKGQKKTLKEALKEGLGALPSQTKKGLLRTGLDAFGLGGIDDVLSDVMGIDDTSFLGKGVKKTGRGVGKLLSKIPGLRHIPGLGKLSTWGAEIGAVGAAGAAGAATKAPGLISRIGSKVGGLLTGIGGKAVPVLSTVGSAATGGAISPGVAGKAMGAVGKYGGKLLGGVGKFAAKAALPLALASAAYDTVTGFTQAEKITGNKENNLTQKTGAAVSSLLSGLSFGIFDKKKIYEGLSIVGNGVTETFDDLSGIVADGKLSTLEKVKQSLAYMWDSLKGFFSDMGGWIGESLGIDFLKKKSPMQASANSTIGGANSGDVDSIAKAQIKKEEGLNLNKYKDAHGKSIGYGHFVREGEKIPENITKEYAEQLFEDDYEGIKNFVTTRLKVSLSPAQIASLLSFGYNAGPGAVAKVIDKLNAGDEDGAIKTMSTTNKSRTSKGGPLEVNPALVVRREREISQFRSGATNRTKAPVQASAFTMDSSASTLSKKNLDSMRANQNRQQAPVFVPMPQQQSKNASMGAPRLTGIEDVQLAFVNLDIFGR